MFDAFTEQYQLSLAFGMRQPLSATRKLGFVHPSGPVARAGEVVS